MSKAKDLDALKQKLQDGQYHNFPLKNVILQYPHLAEPDTKFDAVGAFKVNCIIADDVASDMEHCGFNVKENDDGQKYVVVKRKPNLGAPTVVDTNGDDVDARSIGNGSIADVEVSTKYWDVGSRPSQSLYIQKITITDLVTYESQDSEELFG